jgi:hypothetical protein
MAKIEQQSVLDRYSFFIAEVSSIRKIFFFNCQLIAGCHRCTTAVATGTTSTDGTNDVRTIHHRSTERTVQTGTEENDDQIHEGTFVF